MSNLFYLEHPSSGAKNTNIAQTSTTTTTTSSPQHEKKNHQPKSSISFLNPDQTKSPITNKIKNHQHSTIHCVGW